MKRRNFLASLAGAAVASKVPKAPAPEAPVPEPTPQVEGAATTLGACIEVAVIRGDGTTVKGYIRAL